jgi:hypothetical protein
MKRLRQIKSPAALATFGAFFVPEPLGACLVLVAAIWWSCRKLGRRRSQGGLASSLPPAESKEPIASTAAASLGA